MTLREKITAWRPVIIIAVVTAALGAFVVPMMASSGTANAAAVAAAQGLNCTKTDKANGGFVLDCDPGSVTPSPNPSASVSGSPSSTPTASASASPSSSTSSPTPSASISPSNGCPVSGRNVPGGADPWGGCWPGPGNTGVPAGTALSAYTGPCVITAAGTLIDSKTVTCSTLEIRAAGVTIRKSMLQGVNVTNGSNSTGAFTIEDSTVVNGARDQCECIGNHNFVARRLEVRGGNRSMYCAHDCIIEDSWLHGQQLQGAQHGSGLREEQRTTATHSVLVCDYPITNDATSLGCSADLTGYPDFAPIHDNTIRRNLFLASITSSFCAYGGASGGKPFSNDPLNATNQKFVENVFQRGSNGKCGFYGPTGDFAPGKPGFVWSGNVWDNGGAVPLG